MSSIRSITRTVGRHSVALSRLKLPRLARIRAGRPFVAAIEGPNGAGKTTLCRALSRDLHVPSCLGTDEAWFANSFKARMIRDAEWHASAMFFLSGCFEQMRMLRGRPGRLVIMDRSLWSTLAVHAAESAERLSALLSMLGPVAGLVRVPDLTLVLEASFSTCQKRIARKPGPARALDGLTATPGFQAKENAFYHWLARQRQEVVFLDAERPAEEVARTALMLVRKMA